MYKILIADDEILIRHIMVNKLDINKIKSEHIYEADNGKMALEMFKEYSPDIVILDIKMPKMDGLEVASNIRMLSPETPIIIMSGYDSFEYAQKAIKILINDYLLKPVKITALEDAILKAEEEIQNKKATKKGWTEKLMMEAINGRGMINTGFPFDKYETRIVLFSFNEKRDTTWNLLIDHAFVRYGIMNVLKETVDSEESVFFEDNMGNVVLMLCKQFNSRAETDEYVEDLRLTIEGAVSVFIIYGISDVCRKDYDIRKCYLNALERMKVPENEDNDYSVVVRKAKQYINEHIDSEVSLSAIAQYVHMSPTYFSALFKKETGKNFSKYVTTIKIEAAKKMLSENNMKIYEVAEQLGFESSNYFGQLFKKYTKMTVSEYISIVEKKNRGQV